MSMDYENISTVGDIWKYSPAPMTLRQWYAGMALAGCLSGGGDEVLLDDDCKDIERAFRNHQADVAKACFSYADAMIAESERTPHAQATRTA